jgi:hypothetical protein
MGMLKSFLNWMRGKKEPEKAVDPLEFYKIYNPDHIWRAPGAITFFYDPNTDWLAKVDGQISHKEMLAMPEFGPKLLPDLWQQNINAPRSEVVKRGIFSGRLIPHQIVTLWNTDKALYEGKFQNFLKKLQQEGLIDGNTVIRSPIHEAFYAKDKLGEYSPTLNYDPGMLHSSPGGYTSKIRGPIPVKEFPWRNIIGNPRGQGIWRGTSENTECQP